MASSISYGPGVPGDDQLRLCGDVAGKRVIELGLADPPNSLVFAERGAKAIAVDPSAERIAAARAAADGAGVRVELHHGDLADLGFATSGSVDLVVSAGALAHVDDLARVFRQVHRVLRSDAPFVLTVPHPIGTMLEGGQLVLRQPYAAAGLRTVSGLFTTLARANFQVDVLAEPSPTDQPGAFVPAALVIRARKLGS